MTDVKEFNSYNEMTQSNWLKNIKKQMSDDIWPKECVRCMEAEKIGNSSVRLSALADHKTFILKNENYLVVDAVLDNICNLACQHCSSKSSTKIGSLKSKNYIIIENVDRFWSLPTDNIVEIDLSGGDPSASKNVQRLFENIPKNVEKVRIYTNGQILISNLQKLIDRNIDVTVSVSIDGIGAVHEYMRWPSTWDRFLKNLMIYKNMPGIHLSLWTTVSALNINDLDNIFKFAEENNISHNYSFLSQPKVYNVKYKNYLTKKAKQRFKNSSDQRLVQIAEKIACGIGNQLHLRYYIHKQDKLRKISIKDYITIQGNNND